MRWTGPRVSVRTPAEVCVATHTDTHRRSSSNYETLRAAGDAPGLSLAPQLGADAPADPSALRRERSSYVGPIRFLRAAVVVGEWWYGYGRAGRACAHTQAAHLLGARRLQHHRHHVIAALACGECRIYEDHRLVQNGQLGRRVQRLRHHHQHAQQGPLLPCQCALSHDGQCNGRAAGARESTVHFTPRPLTSRSPSKLAAQIPSVSFLLILLRGKTSLAVVILRDDSLAGSQPSHAPLALSHSLRSCPWACTPSHCCVHVQRSTWISGAREGARRVA